MCLWTVLDYAIKSLFCKECSRFEKLKETDPLKYEAWEKSHDSKCEINHQGSSGAMEKECAVEMFLRSVELHELKYTTFVGDGDTNSFGEVKKVLERMFGEDYPVHKEDCFGHLQKRMGSAIRVYKNLKKGVKLADGKTVGGKGRLTDDVADRVQTYYGYAIRNNKGNTKDMQDAIWAILYHVMAGPSYETLAAQHWYCPVGPNSWCKYQRDVTNGTNMYNPSKCLPFIFRSELKHIFTRLSSDELLKNCQMGYTQNQNEALHNIIWSKCSKRVFCGKKRFEIAVCESIMEWNSGACSKIHILNKLGMEAGINSRVSLKNVDVKRVRDSSRKFLEKYKIRQQKLRQKCKKKGKLESVIFCRCFFEKL